MTGLSDNERYVLNEFQEGNSPLKAVLAKFCDLRADEYRRRCTQRMSIVPRDVERAADDAAKADVYESFMRGLMNGLG
jgi:hypothetical protein